MTNLNNYDIFLGTVAGSLLRLKIDKPRDEGIVKGAEQGKCEITSLSWGRTNLEILIGYKNGNIGTHNIITNNTEINVTDRDTSRIVGLIPLDDDVLLASNNGNVYMLKNNAFEPYIKNLDSKKTLEKMVINPNDQNIVAMGGLNQDITIYDINNKNKLFVGKADSHDELNLAQPISISDITYLNINKFGMNIATVTRQGQIRCYDTRAQRRPVKIFKKNESVYTTIAVTNTDNHIIVGTTRGYMQLMDFRGAEIKPVKTYKGFMGGIVDIVCDPEAPIVASCALDRYFRIHNLKNHKINHQEYMKIQPTGILMRPRSYILPPSAYDDEPNKVFMS